MKKLNILFLILNFTFVFSQKKIAVVKSNTEKVKIIESGEVITNWTLNSSQKPDVYTTGKIQKSKIVKLVTDVDSLEVKLKPGQKFDFVVLLNKKDSCFTRFQSPTVLDFSKSKPVLHDTIPFRLTKYNNISVKAVLNGKETIDMMFDTGATDFYLIKSAIKKYLNQNGKIKTMKDIADETFKIGNLEWKHQQIYPIETTGQENDGMFGWNAFDGKVLEIDFDKNIMVAHSRKPKIDKAYEKFPMEIIREQFYIYVDMEHRGKKYRGRYNFDSGFQKTAILNKAILKQDNLSINDFKVIKETKMFNSNNDPIPLKTVSLDGLHFGKFVLKNLPADVGSEDLVRGLKSHFLGGDVLKRFNMILDFQKNVVYLKPNSLYYGDFIKS